MFNMWMQITIRLTKPIPCFVFNVIVKITVSISFWISKVREETVKKGEVIRYLLHMSDISLFCTVLAFYRLCNTVPETQWHMTIEIYFYFYTSGS